MAAAFWSPEARADAEQIWEYIARYDPATADRLLDQILETCQMLADNPGAGRRRENLAPGLRSFPVRRYLVFYTIEVPGIVVVRVIHGARNYRDQFSHWQN